MLEQSKEFKEFISGFTSIGRLLQPEEIAQVVSFWFFLWCRSLFFLSFFFVGFCWVFLECLLLTINQAAFLSRWFSWQRSPLLSTALLFTPMADKNRKKLSLSLALTPSFPTSPFPCCTDTSLVKFSVELLDNWPNASVAGFEHEQRVREASFISADVTMTEELYYVVPWSWQTVWTPFLLSCNQERVENQQLQAMLNMPSCECFLMPPGYVKMQKWRMEQWIGLKNWRISP